MNLPQSWSKPFTVTVMGLLVAIFYITVAGHFSYTADDSYIYFQYARSVAQGEGPCFNPGEPTYGFTSPLWLLMLSAAGVVGADIPLAGKALDMVFASVAIVLFFMVVLEMTRDQAVSFCASLAFSVNAWLVRWAGSGLETSLAVVLLTAFLLALLRNGYAAAAGLLGLLTLVRPEACLLLPLLLLDLKVNSLDPARLLRDAVRAVSLWLLIVFPWTVYAYAKFGRILPSTFDAKSGAGIDPGAMAGTAADAFRTLASADGAVYLVLAASFGTFVVLGRRRAALTGDGRVLPLYHFRQGLVAVLWIVLLPAAYILLNVNIVSRYLLLMTPPAIALAYFYLHELIRDRSAVLRYGLVLAMTAVAMVQNQAVYARYVVPHMDSFTEGVQACLVPIAERIRKESPPEAVVMTGDVGAIGWYSRRTICDFNGIVSTGERSGPRTNEAFTELLRAGRWGNLCVPAFVVHRSGVPEELGDVPGLVAIMSRPFPGLSISDAKTVYFTLYRVEYTSPDKMLTAQ